MVADRDDRVADDGIARGAGGRGAYRAGLRARDFTDWRDALRELYDELEGARELTTFEESIAITVTGDGLGHSVARCEARDGLDGRCRLRFELAFDQSDLPAVLVDSTSSCAPSGSDAVTTRGRGTCSRSCPGGSG